MLFGLIWLWTDTEALVRHARSAIGLGNAPLALSSRGYWAAFALAWVPAGLFVLAMLRLGSLFRAFGEGRVLVEENAVGLLRVGWLLAGQDWPKGFATTTLLLLLAISLNAMFLGIIGEYVGRIFMQSKRRPRVVVEQALNAEPRHVRVLTGSEPKIGARAAPADALGKGASRRVGGQPATPWIRTTARGV